jgi:RNA polymerase sigma factor (sigma-70 family)
MSSLSSAAAPARTAAPHLRLSNLGDELLARYAGRGSDRAFAALYERYHQPLYRYCRSILRDETDAQDALQSTFVGALQALKRDQRNAPLRPWLYRIAHNEAISLLRRRSRDASDELDAESLGMATSVEQEVADRARWRSLVEDLSSLPERQRGALLLRELSGLSHEEIALTLGTTTAAAKQAIFEARQALAEIAEGRAMSCEEVRQRISEGDRRVLRGRRMTAHLRQCAACDAFALAIPARRAELRALTPALPPAAAAALLARTLHTASSHAGVSGASAAATAGAAGKAAGTALAWKAVAGVALVATTAAGVTGISHLLTAPRPAVHLAPPAVIRHHSDLVRSHGSGIVHRGGGSALDRRSSRHARAATTAPARHHSAANHQGTHRSTASSSQSTTRGGSHTGSSAAQTHGQPVSPGHSSASHGRSTSAPGHYSAAVHHSGSHRHLRIHVRRIHVFRHVHAKATVKKILTLVSPARSAAVGTHSPSR